MNVIIDDREYKPDLGDGVPVPNIRQAVRLGEMIDRLLVDVIKDLDHDPDDYLPRFEAFAATLKGAWAAKILAIGARDLAMIRMCRKRATRWLEQISDSEILQAFDTTMPISREWRLLFETATGTSESWNHSYSYYGGSRHNVLLKNAHGFGKRLRTYDFIKPKEKKDLPLPFPEGLISYYNKLPGINTRKKKVKEASSNFSSAYWQVMSNVRVADQLFAERLRLMWRLVDAENEYKRLVEKLTKPLEDYACYWEGYGKANHLEYKHKGAEATRVAKENVAQLKKQRGELEELIDNPGWSIAALVQEAWNTCEIFKIILEASQKENETQRDKMLAREKKLRQKQLAQEKRLREKQQLAEKPIRVPAVLNQDGLWIDHRALVEGLKDRTNVTKRYGRSYLDIKGVLVETSKLKQWLTMALQDPATNKRIPKNKWGQVQWAYVGTSKATKETRFHRKEEMPSIYFIVQLGSMRVTTSFYDQSDEFEGYNSYNRKPVINKVEPAVVEAQIPKRRGVWTPKDINEYHPVLVPIQG